MSDSIVEMLQAGYIKEMPSRPHVVIPLSVHVQSNGKKRLICDLRHVNSFIEKIKIKMDDLKVAKDFLENSALCTTFDIKKGYYHIDVCDAHQTFLGFAWKINGVLRFFQYTVIPFGISLGPYVFTKVVRALVLHWRAKRFRIVVYIDDGLIIGLTFVQCDEMTTEVVSDLKNSGFLLNEKCCLTPSQKLVWLGVTIDTLRGVFDIPDTRITRTCDAISGLLANDVTL